MEQHRNPSFERLVELADRGRDVVPQAGQVAGRLGDHGHVEGRGPADPVGGDAHRSHVVRRLERRCQQVAGDAHVDLDAAVV